MESLRRSPRSIRVMLLVTLALHAVGMGCEMAASDAETAEVSTAEQRVLAHHLMAWRVCHGMHLLDGEGECWPVPDPPPALADLAEQLRSLSRLDELAAHETETGLDVGPLGRCHVSISTEVSSILDARLRGRIAARLGGGGIEASCDGVLAPNWPADRPPLGFARSCEHVRDSEGRMNGQKLGRCIRTLADSWMAEAGVGPPLKRPNIVVILTDDQRWDTIDATHSPMPAIGLPAMPATYSRLAREGVSFSQAVVTTSICGPSRGSYFTGLHSYRHGMLANAGPFGPSRFKDGDTWATRLDEAGYRTGFLGKYTNGFTDLWTPGVDAPYIPPGWDDFRTFNHVQSVPQTGFSMIENGVIVSYDTDEQPYATDVLRDQALDFIDAAQAESPDEPFALWISTTVPHYPWDPAPRHDGAFNGMVDLVLYPSTFEEDVSDKPQWVQERPLPGPIELAFGQRFFRRTQLEMQLSVDEMVAALLDRLEAHGVGDDTIFVYTSDNGHAWGEHRWNSKACPWEECLKVPMLVRYPRLIPGPRTETGLVANVDLMPTLLSLAGASVPEDIDGVDLGAALRGFEAAPERDVLFEAYAGVKFTYAGVRANHLKYFVYSNGDEVLHDLEADPWELENMLDWPEYQDTVEAMRTRLGELWPGFEGVRL